MDNFGDDEDGTRPLDVPGWPVATHRNSAGSSRGWVYSPELGQAIVALYVDEEAGGLWGVHHMAPDRVPPPGIVRAWCKQFPAFGIAMREADQLRAEKMMEQTVVLADSGTGSVQRVALQISTRQTFAASLDGARYGKGAGSNPPPPRLGADAQPVAIEVSDEALAALALAGMDEAAARQG